MLIEVHYFNYLQIIIYSDIPLHGIPPITAKTIRSSYK